MPETPPPTVPLGPAAGCEAFADLIHRVLDGEAPVAALEADPHIAACVSCQSIRQSVVHLLDGLNHSPGIEPSATFAERTTRAAMSAYRRRRMMLQTTRIAVGALAASVLLCVWLASPRSPLADRGAFARWWPAATPNQEPLPPAPTPDPNHFANNNPPRETIRGQIGEAGSALVSLTKKATEDTFAPARTLFNAPTNGRGPQVKATTGLPEPLVDFPDSAKAGIEPITDTARRAVNLFLRDVGGAAGASKMKS